MIEESKNLRIKFDLGANSLYDLAYLSLDIYHLIVFCELLQPKDIEALEKMYYNPRMYSLTRYNRILQEFSKKAEVKDVKNGSIELVVAGVSTIAAIVVPFIAVSVQRKMNREDARLIFEISAEDEVLSRLIDEVGQGYYGRGEDGINWLLQVLAQRGYILEILGENAYKISKVLDRYEQRIIKTIKKYT